MGSLWHTAGIVVNLVSTAAHAHTSSMNGAQGNRTDNRDERGIRKRRRTKVIAENCARRSRSSSPKSRTTVPSTCRLTPLPCKTAERE